MVAEKEDQKRGLTSDGDLRCRLEFVFDVVAVTAGPDDADLTVPTWFGVDLLFLDLGLIAFTFQELLAAFDADWIFHVM